MTDLSFSMYIDTRKISMKDELLSSTPPDKDIILKKINNFYPKQTDKWVDSYNILNCQMCNYEFGYFGGKHHCRVCGCVFCSSCCYKYIEIPNTFKKPLEDNDYIRKNLNNIKSLWSTQQVGELVCNNCYVKIENHNKKINMKDDTKLDFIQLLTIFEWFDIDTLYKSLLICKKFNDVGVYMLSKIRSIQYIHHNTMYSEWEIDKVWKFKKYMCGHNGWKICIIKSMLYKFYKSHDENLIMECINILNCEINTSCRKMMCSRKCNISVDLYDFIEIINIIILLEKNIENIFWINNKLMNFVITMYNYLYKQSDIETYNIMKSLIPLFCSSIINLCSCGTINTDTFEKFMNMILSKIDRDTWNYLIIEVEYLREKNTTVNPTMLFANIVLNYVRKIDEYKIISNKINKMIKTLCDIVLDGNGDFPIVFPFDFNYEIIKILNVDKMNSNSKPLLLTLTVKHIRSQKIETKKLILKKDIFLRKERIVSSVLELLQHRLAQHSQRHRIDKFIPIPTYQILTLKSDIGVIEFVDNSITLGKIDTMNLSLQNYILSKNKNDTVGNVKNRYMQSLAISSCLSYILGLGDRHLDNIMINNYGQIFNIDYGYLMDNPATSVLSAPNIKVTKIMIDFLGDYNDEFKKFITQVYDILRLYRNMIFMYYEILSDENIVLDWEKFSAKLDSRFLDGLNKNEIENTLMNEINSSNSLLGNISDFCRYYKKYIS